MPLNQVILAWMIKRHVIPIFGASRDEQIVENLGAAAVELTDEQMAMLNDAGA